MKKFVTFRKLFSSFADNNGRSMNENLFAPIERKHTVDDYLKLERRNTGNHDFIDGRIIAKANSSRTHSLIVTNATIAVGSRLRGQNCEVYAGNMRVQLSSSRFCYPSVVVVNGKPVFSNAESDTLLNPTVVVEIFSPTSHSSEKNEKLESYLAMDSVKECLLVKENEMRIEHYAKQTVRQWVYKIYNTRDDVISLDSVNCKTSVAEVYSQIKFEDAVKQIAAA